MIDLHNIRNISIIAHIDAGKTTTTERILYYTGKIQRMGDVDEGTATMDYWEQERERGITIIAATTTCYWRDTRINIVDTPGHVDFTAEVEKSLMVIDGAVVIFSAVEGVESQSETVWYQADRHNLPRLIYINKLDRIGADYESVIKMMEERLNIVALPLQLPIGKEAEFHGVIDLVSERALIWQLGTDGSHYDVTDIPGPFISESKVAHEELIEKLADLDDEFAEIYLEKGEISPTHIKHAIRRVTLSTKAFPVYLGASLRNVGVQPLLDGIVDYLPSPVERPPIKGVSIKTHKEVERAPNPESAFLGKVFKIQATPHGDLGYLRIYAGKLKKGDVVLNTTRNVKERISQIFLLHANERTPVKVAHAGEIVGIMGIKATRTGDTLAAPSSPIVLGSMKFPDPVIYVSIEPKTMAEEDKLESVLERLVHEDPTLRVRLDEETGQRLLEGMGELHLEVIIERLRREFKLDVRTGKPQVAYRETITETGTGEAKVDRDVGGKHHYAYVKLQVEPLSRGEYFAFVNQVPDIPATLLNAVERGIRENMGVGPLAGYPVIDVKATLVGVDIHPTDSTELAFLEASALAFRKALSSAKPILLEPIMKLEIIIPMEYLGVILDDLNARDGKIKVMENRAPHYVVIATCPLRKLFGYATTIRSLTQGRGVCMMEFETYEPLTESIPGVTTT